MAIINGTDVKVFSGNQTSSANLVAFAQNCTININNTTRDITNKQSGGWSEKLESLRDWSIDMDGAYAWTDAAGSPLSNGIDDLIASNIMTRVPLNVSFGASVGSTGGARYSGSAWLTSVSATGGTEDTSTYSLTLEGTGALTLVVL